MNFRVISESGGARCAEFDLAHGPVQTPVFMPVATRGAIRALPMRDIQEMGFPVMLANTYHLYIRPGLDILRQAGGVRGFMNYRGPILTDSGGFQVFSLANLCKIREDACSSAPTLTVHGICLHGKR
jgi:queuine tRNA-ribosyltransferase